MKKNLCTLLLLSLLGSGNLQAQRTEVLLKEGWTFHKGDTPESPKAVQQVTVPHDWAIYGPFSRDNDLQKVAVIQNGETEETIKTGRTGGLPYVGVGTYTTEFELDETEGKSVTLLFDGAMSEAQVEVNGTQVGFWPYGYNSFSCDITGAAVKGTNTLRVRLENRDQSSRWYSGAGLYRNVHLITTDRIHIPVWGTHITTPYIGKEYASVTLRTTLEGVQPGDMVSLYTRLIDDRGNTVARDSAERKIFPQIEELEQRFTIREPRLWSPESPVRYSAVTEVWYQGRKVDTYTTPFGLRTIEFRAEKGFFLNGQPRKFRGVCNHHDLGPLGAAVNKAALRRQLTLLKEMGADAIRTAHNMPAPELVELCDEMGFMMMVETFDEWDLAKCKNGYHRYFDEWAGKDIANVIRHYRNNPCVVMWSIGNEIPSQWKSEGVTVAKRLQECCHRLDPTRPVTCGMDQVDAVLENGFASVLDIPGLNYRVHKYLKAHAMLPQKILLGSETSSTVSSRGVYKFPAGMKADALYPDHQSSGYDTEYCSWSNIPDFDLAMAEDHEWEIGQFVWTGFDYLGEPSPYDTDAWPNHSSMFGIIDLASIPKDRYWLYRSVWNRDKETLHILPHWNWQGREGEITPVFVYTSYPKAELFINGRSQGVREKNDSTVMHRYRLMWNETRYEPGEVKVVAYDAAGKPAAERIIRTAGKPYALKLEADRTRLTADGEDLSYITVKVVDREGNEVPTATHEVTFSAKGAGRFLATANGDPTNLNSFQEPHMPLFSGAATAIVQAGKQAGELQFKATAKGLKSAQLVIQVEE